MVRAGNCEQETDALRRPPGAIDTRQSEIVNSLALNPATGSGLSPGTQLMRKCPDFFSCTAPRACRQTPRYLPSAATNVTPSEVMTMLSFPAALGSVRLSSSKSVRRTSPEYFSIRLMTESIGSVVPL